MADSTVTFKPGDDVTLYGLMAREYGEGPFPIVQTEKVISKCNCGFDPKYFPAHREYCGIFNQKKLAIISM